MARNNLPGGLWQSQGVQNARIENGVLRAQLQRKDGTWADAEVSIDPPYLANFNGQFVPAQSYDHLRALATPSSGGGGGGGDNTGAIVGSSLAIAAAVVGALL